MADYRLIFRNAATGERTSSLSHLGFRVWVQYQLSADDFGVCPAIAAKLQGDNTALAVESARRIQSEIENLITVGLCGVFSDGRRRYLYQPDWQDWQKLRYAATSSLPRIPTEVFPKCSPKTLELLRQKDRSVPGTFPPRARTCDAPANADASADALEGGPGETAPRRAALAPGLVVSSAEWHRQHGRHVSGFCAWVCFPQSVFDEFVRRVAVAGTTEHEAILQVDAWAADVRSRWAGKIPGDDIFAFWRHEWQATHGSNRPAAATSRAQLDPASGVREALTRG